MKKIKRKITWICILMGLLIFIQFPVLAEKEAKIMEIGSNGSQILLYVKGIEGKVKSSKALIGNKECVVKNITNLSEGRVPLKTLILIDNSISIPEADRNTIKEILLEMIAGRSRGELFSVASFSESIDVKTDFTDDYTVLKNAIDELEYVDQETYLTDVLYELLHDNFNKDGEDAYIRILVISDGVDNKSIGYTADELSGLLKEQKIPIYCIGITNSSKSNDEQLKNMFAISRQTNADSFLLSEMDDAMAVLDVLALDRGIVCFTVQPDFSLQDGSQKTIALNIESASENISVMADQVRMPQKAVKEADATEHPEKETVEQHDRMNPSDFSEPMQPPPEDSMPKKSLPGNLLLALAIGIVVIIGGVLFILYFVRKKRRDSATQNAIDPFATAFANEQKLEKTVQMFEQTPLKRKNGSTLYMWEQENHYTLILTDAASPDKIFQKPIQDRLVIGRSPDHADICIDYERTVSAQHCAIEQRNGRFFLIDLQSSNGTFLNGSRVLSEEEIYSGCNLRMGRAEMIVEFSMEG